MEFLFASTLIVTFTHIHYMKSVKLSTVGAGADDDETVVVVILDFGGHRFTTEWISNGASLSCLDRFSKDRRQLSIEQTMGNGIVLRIN